MIVNQIKNGVSRRRVGIQMNAGPPARQGIEIFVDNQKVGQITSGCPSPSIGENVAMGYINENLKKPGTNVELRIRGKQFIATVTKMPFVKSNYYVKPK